MSANKQPKKKGFGVGRHNDPGISTSSVRFHSRSHELARRCVQVCRKLASTLTKRCQTYSKSVLLPRIVLVAPSRTHHGKRGKPLKVVADRKHVAVVEDEYKLRTGDSRGRGWVTAECQTTSWALGCFLWATALLLLGYPFLSNPFSSFPFPSRCAMTELVDLHVSQS